MKPVRISAHGYRSFADLDYRFAEGATAVTGTNGAGKSTLIGAVEIALFGPRSRSLEPLVREGEDEMQVELEFEHGDTLYRVRRGWKKGKSTLDLERLAVDHDPDERDQWQPLTQGSAADTQTLLEQAIGLSRSTFLASGYLAQRQSDTFTGAQPKDRKKILSDALALEQWAKDAATVAGDRRALESRVETVNGRVDALAGQAAAAEALAVEAGDLRLLADISSAGETEARAQAEQHSLRAAELDQAETKWAVRRSAVDAASARLSGHQKLLERTTTAKTELDQARQELVTLGPAADISDLLQRRERLETEIAAYMGAVTARDAAVALQEARTSERTNHEALATRLRDMEREARAKAHELADAPEHDAICDRCEQHLPDDARKRAVDSMMAEADEHGRLGAHHERAAVAVEIPDIPSVPVPPAEGPLTQTIADIESARAHASKTEVIGERIAGLERTIGETDTDEYRETTRRLEVELREATEQFAGVDQPEPGAADHARAAALQAKAAAEAHASRGRTARERLAAVTALLEQAEAAALEHTAAVAERVALHEELDILKGLEQAFGRDGVPAWIVESVALPHIEVEANVILARLGGAISRVELRTERETKTGERRDALDIVCMTDDGERALETFSGGEQARAEIALALGLVAVLQSRRDADLRYLALDEPNGLDSQGTEALAEVLRERAAGTVVLLASHDASLRDSFDQAITVERGPGGSRVLA